MDSLRRIEKLRLARKREIYFPTRRGWLVCLIAFLALIAGSLLVLRQTIVPFLAKTAPIPSEALVLEGWVPDELEPDVRAEFNRGKYALLILTGSDLTKGEPLVEFKNYATMTRSVFLRRGWKESQVIAVPCGRAVRDRTYTSALALKEWLIRHSESGIHSINVMSNGVHSRRTWLLYRKALEGVANVGVIASRDISFDPKHWWRSSDGVRATIDETVAYLYARWIFSP